MADKRIIELANEKLVLADGDMTIVDSENGTYKYDLNRLAKKTITDTTLSVEGKPADAKAVGDALASVDVDTVNNARQLLSENYVLDQEPYLFRASGGEGADRVEECIVGGSVGWNQLVQMNIVPSALSGITYTASADGNSCIITGTATANEARTGWFGVGDEQLISGHKILCTSKIIKGSYTGHFQYYISQTRMVEIGTSKIAIVPETGQRRLAFTIDNGTAFANDFEFNMNFIDLTTLFGPTIADYIYQLEQATAGAGVAWFRKYFPEDYYEYSAPTLRHVEGVSSKEVVGRNLFDAAKAVHNSNVSSVGTIFYDTNYCRSDYIPVIYGEQYYVSVLPVVISFKADKTFNRVIRNTPNAGSFITNDPNDAFVIIRNYSALSTTQAQNDAINTAQLELGSTATAYEPYHKNIYPLDSTLSLRGIPKLTDGKMWFDGDKYEADGTVQRRYALVDLGTLTWTYYNIEGHKRYGAYFIAKNASLNLICPRYETVSYNAVFNNIKVGIAVHHDGTQLVVYDTSFNDAATFKAAMSGVYLVYELATPTEETAQPYTNPQRCFEGGTEEFVSTGIVPVGHYSKYLENLRSKIEGLPKDFSTLIAPTEKEYKATQNYTVGSLLIVDNVLYKATANIANGATITPNTNVTATTLAAVIAALA